MMKAKTQNVLTRLAVFCAFLALSACGGGGGGGSSSAPTPTLPTTPTPLPASLSITGSLQGDVAQAVEFRADAANADGLTWKWDFGDGSTSAAPAPTYRYSRGGDYEVELLISNSAGERRSARALITVTNKAHVQGFACEGANQSRWCWQFGKPLDSEVVQGPLVAVDAYWALNSKQEWLRSLDGGMTWGQRGDISFALEGYPISALRLLVGSRDTAWIKNESAGTLWRTTNGGSAWVRLTLPPGRYTAHAWPLNAYGQLRMELEVEPGGKYVSVDSGSTWSLRGAPVRKEPLARESDEFVVASDGAVWRQGYTDDCPTLVCRSSDGGVTFNPVNATLPVPAYMLKTLHAGPGNTLIFQGQDRFVPDPDPSVGRFTMRTFFLLSTDGGANWTYMAGNGLPARGCPGYSCSMFLAPYKVHARAGGEIWISDTFRLFHSLDGGESWTPVNAPPAAAGYLSLQLPANAEGSLVVADRNSFWISVTGGKRWTRGLPISNVPWADNLSAAGLGPQGLIAVGGIVQRSGDAGRTWAEASGCVPGPFDSLSFPGSRRGWFVANYQTLCRVDAEGDGSAVTLWTAPSTWPAGDPDNVGALYISKVRFRNDTSGLMALSSTIASANLKGRSALLASTDGGVTWTERGRIPMVAVHDLLAVDDQRVLAAGLECYSSGAPTDRCHGRVYLSLDGGRTWSLAWESLSQVPQRLALQPLTGTLWMVGRGGLLARSTDQGQSWTPVTPTWDGSVVALGYGGENHQPLIELMDIGFADGRNGWFVGAGGVIYGTRDGGASWSMQRAYQFGVSNLYSLVVADAKTVWAFGDRGAVLSTGTGGY